MPWWAPRHNDPKGVLHERTDCDTDEGEEALIKVGGTTPTFGVADIEAARSHMESRGVRFDGDTHEIEGMVKLCTFYDPDGNPFMLAEVLDVKDERAS